MLFSQGDSVLNIGKDARNHGKMGTYHRRLPWHFWSTGGVLEPACDVLNVLGCSCCKWLSEHDVSIIPRKTGLPPPRDHFYTPG